MSVPTQALKREEFHVFVFQGGSFVITAWGKILTYFFIFFFIFVKRFLLKFKPFPGQQAPRDKFYAHWLPSPPPSLVSICQNASMTSVYIRGRKTEIHVRLSQVDWTKYFKKADNVWREGKLRPDGTCLCSLSLPPHRLWRLHPRFPKLLGG